MTPARWRQIEDLFDSAVELEPARRAGFLAEACAGDDGLRRELESLLAFEHEAKQFLELPAWEMTQASLAEEERLTGSAPLPAGQQPRRALMITWSMVRGFGKVKYFNVSCVILLVVPILAELHQKAAVASEIFGKMLPFPVTLCWLYVASFSYAIAIALYQYFCPSIVKSFGSPEEYVADSHEIFRNCLPAVGGHDGLGGRG